MGGRITEMFDFLATEPENVAERAERYGSFKITDDSRKAKNQIRREHRKQKTQPREE